MPASRSGRDTGPTRALLLALALWAVVAATTLLPAQNDVEDPAAGDVRDENPIVEAPFDARPASSASRLLEQHEYVFFSHRRHLWVYRKSTHSVTFYTVPETSDRKRPIRVSRPFVIDEREFPLEALHLRVSERNLTNYLWLLNPHTGKARVLNARRDGTIVESRLLDLAIGGTGPPPGGGVDYRYYTFRRSLWVFQRSTLTIRFYTFPEAGHDDDIQRSRVYNIDPLNFPVLEIQMQVAQRNLSSYLWLLNPVTGKATILKARRDGMIEESALLDVEKQE